MVEARLLVAASLAILPPPAPPCRCLIHRALSAAVSSRIHIHCVAARTFRGSSPSPKSEHPNIALAFIPFALRVADPSAVTLLLERYYLIAFRVTLRHARRRCGIKPVRKYGRCLRTRRAPFIHARVAMKSRLTRYLVATR